MLCMSKLLQRVLLPVFLLLFSALACNLPVGPRPGQPSSREAARRTLEAQLFPTLQALEDTPHPFENLATAAPGQTAVPPQPTAPVQLPPAAGEPYLYFTQSGDTLAAVAAHFEVDPGEIAAGGPLSEQGYLPPGTALGIPFRLPPAAYPNALLPDSEVVYSPSAAGFNTAAFVSQAGGFLASYREDVDGHQLSGAEIIQRIAVETAINPRVLLAVLEHRSGWVFGSPRNPNDLRYPVGFFVDSYQGLWKEMTLTARQLTLGYYGWRDGTLEVLEFIGGQPVRISPQLNAGTVAVQYLYSKLLERSAWEQALYGADSLPAAAVRIFGDPWERAAGVEPLFPAGLAQPDLTLPFAPGERWSMTGGPHLAWGVGSPRSALDFAPVTGEPACQVSRAWALAPAAGVVVRSERAQLALDLDGDGSETTGWVIFFYHLSDQERAPAGTRVEPGGRLGHPSCQGGRTTGTHFHIARKYNGEWLPAGSPLPLVMDGWSVKAGEKPYEGWLVKGDQVVTSRPGGDHDSIIVRQD